MFRDLDTTVTISLSSYKRQKLDLSHLSLEVNNKLNIYCLQAHFIKEKNLFPHSLSTTCQIYQNHSFLVKLMTLNCGPTKL